MKISSMKKLMTCLIGGAIFVLAIFVVQAQGEFPLKEGDIWVMAGDSITQQHLHTNYFEAFCYARFPKIKFCFRNSGTGGNRVTGVITRFDWDIAAWNPTVVSVEIGMNDIAGSSPDQFAEKMSELVGKIRSINASPVLFSPSPINNGNPLSKLDSGNTRLKEFTNVIGKISRKENIPYADQFTPLVDLWAQNKPQEDVAIQLTSLRTLLDAQPNLAGAGHAKAFLEVWDKMDKPPVSMMGNPIHPGPTGQLTMAATLLTCLKAPGLVSRLSIDAKTGIFKRSCTVQNEKQWVKIT